MGLSSALCAGLALTGWVEQSHGTELNGHPGRSEHSSPAGASTLTIADFTDMKALEAQVNPQCEARYSWPVKEPQVEQEFDSPIAPWAPGHRGVDLMVAPGTEILAPQSGTISFAGTVAGKHVVSVRHRGGITSTFEPATTTLNVGATVTRGQHIGTIGGTSDHCEDRCLHWGLKRGTADYLSPQQYAGNRKIALKPS